MAMSMPPMPAALIPLAPDEASTGRKLLCGGLGGLLSALCVTLQGWRGHMAFTLSVPLLGV